MNPARFDHEPTDLLAFGPLTQQTCKGVQRAYVLRRVCGQLQLWWTRELVDGDKPL